LGFAAVPIAEWSVEAAAAFGGCVCGADWPAASAGASTTSHVARTVFDITGALP
jgi:hypothetical protein